jgi:hypothetical protein
MTFQEPPLGRPLDPPEAHSENTQDVLPTTERSQDPERSMHTLVNEGARPLSDEERKAADRNNPTAGERVYAPASERVPKTVPDYGDVVTHTDTATPERQSAAPQTGQWPQASEPSFTRVARPSDTGATVGSTNGDMDAAWNSQNTNRWMSNMSSGSWMPFGMGWLGVSICAGVGVWLWMRWQRERNKPINRLRRQARQAAQLARDRMPDMPEIPDEATRPALGLGTALLSIALVLWQQSQSRGRTEQAKGRAEKASKQATKQATKKGRQAMDTVSEFDWQQRLMQLRDFWNANRIEMEKVSIPKR